MSQELVGAYIINGAIRYVFTALYTHIHTHVHTKSILEIAVAETGGFQGTLLQADVPKNMLFLKLSSLRVFQNTYRSISV